MNYMKKIKWNERIFQWLMLLTVFGLMFAWSRCTPSVGGPDEWDRYVVAKYIYEHSGQLPHGGAPEIRNEIWGLSYGFYPILSYMVSAVFMWIAGLFHASKAGLLYAARLADVLFVTAAAWFILQAAKRLFQDEKRWLFSVMVLFLPGFQFLGTYVNTDSLALLAAAMIFCAWAKYLKEGWTWKNCILLAAGMGICFLSYYNAYGWILWSFLFFCATVLLCTDRPWKERFRELFSRGFVIAGITLLICGWWFIRNFIIYDGDFLGRSTGAIYAEKYAQDRYKPSQHLAPADLGWNWLDFIFYQDPGWIHNWFMTVLISFVGTFGLMNIYMNEAVSKIYILFLFVGSIGILWMVREFHWRKNTVTITRGMANGKSVIRKNICIYKEWSKKGIFHLTLVGTIVTPVILFLSYAFYNDNQAQGRYIMPALYPFMYFVTCGYGRLLERFVKKEALHVWFYRAACVAWILGAVLNYFLVVVPAYR